MNHVLYKGRPITPEAVAALSGLFARMNAKRPIEEALVRQLIDLGVEFPAKLAKARRQQPSKNPSIVQGV